MRRVNNTPLARLSQLGVSDAVVLARIKHDFIIDLENSDLVPDFRYENFPRCSYSDLFWTFYLLHHLQSQVMSDELRLYTKDLMSKIVDELNRRDFLDFILFSEDLPE